MKPLKPRLDICDSSIRVRSWMAAASLGVCAPLGSISASEAWHLRDGEPRIFNFRDQLRHSRRQLDQILTVAEAGLNAPPAAA
jgi:hypothetical protein